MGMGEPLYNLDNVIKALKIIMDNEGISISKESYAVYIDIVLSLVDVG